ncbi:hypothetical protein AAY473_038341 [Plecturocebus cupreus]
MKMTFSYYLLKRYIRQGQEWFFDLAFQSRNTKATKALGVGKKPSAMPVPVHSGEQASSGSGKSIVDLIFLGDNITKRKAFSWDTRFPGAIYAHGCSLRIPAELKRPFARTPSLDPHTALQGPGLTFFKGLTVFNDSSARLVGLKSACSSKALPYTRSYLQVLAVRFPQLLESEVSLAGIESRWGRNTGTLAGRARDEVLFCCPGWSAVARSWLTVTSTSQVQAGLEFLTSSDPPGSVSHNAGITGVRHRAKSESRFKCKKVKKELERLKSCYSGLNTTGFSHSFIQHVWSAY